MSEQNPLKVFISYSHDSNEHKQKIRNLADTLRIKYGIDVTGDFYDEDAPHGKLFTDLMHGIHEMDTVLMILTPQYKKKADEGQGGAGYESMLITSEIYNNLGSSKFIPVVLEDKPITLKDYFPQFISILRKGILRNSFPNDSKFCEAIARAITNKPEKPKPPLGSSGWSDTQELIIDIDKINYEHLLSNKNSKILFSNSLDLAKRDDLAGFNKLKNKVLAKSFDHLSELRKSHEKSIDRNALTPLMDQFIDAARPIFLLSFAGILSNNPRFIKQEGIMYDLLSNDKWRNWTGSSYVHIHHIPEMLVFVYHHIYGAIHIENLELPDIITLLNTKLPTKKDSYNHLFEMQFLMGWVESLDRDCFESFKFILSAYERWPWLNLLFDSAEEYKQNLVTYQMIIHLFNYFDFVLHNITIDELFENSKVPPSFLVAESRYTKYAMHFMIKHSDFFKEYLEKSKISKDQAILKWDEWRKSITQYRGSGLQSYYLGSEFIKNLLM